MKNFAISKEEKNRILEMHSPKKILSEQLQNLRRFFGGNIDDLFKMFSDDAVKSLDDVFAKIISNPKNISVRGSEYYVKSASGMEIPTKDIQDLVSLVAQGKRDAASISKYLPGKLADGSEFRDIIVAALEKRGAKTAVQKSVSKLPIGRIGQDFMELAKDMGGWIQATNVTGNMSGWKFHVYADNLDEVAFLYERLLPVVKKYGAGFKLAGVEMLEKLAKNSVQKGKGVTLYLPSSTIAKNAQKEFLSDLQSAIKGYEKNGAISGDKMITNNIGYRYELSQPIDVSKGVDMYQYRALYKSNEGGGHNITDNPDLFK